MSLDRRGQVRHGGHSGKFLVLYGSELGETVESIRFFLNFLQDKFGRIAHNLTLGGWVE